MDMPINQITSDMLIEIEQHFRVSAGPGAGKTYWLANHIKNVLHHSERLCASRKIACITYTNIAVERILECLGASADRVEVSTIHSFLYRHIVKPYASFIDTEYGLNVQEIDGHVDHVVRFEYLKHWVDFHPYNNELRHPYTARQLTMLAHNKVAIMKWLSTLHYDFNSSGNLLICSNRNDAYYISEDKVRRYLNKKCLDILEKDFSSYKTLYWQEGILHHDDILFFSYQLIQKFPFVLQVLRAKFPYFFIDEFQDTNPIQTKILEQIGQNETIVGIIGDRAQSIYSFQGAAPDHFTSFTLPDIIDYKMADNRRSTDYIIDILNAIRTDISQSKFRDKEGEKPIINIGNMSASFLKAQEQCNEEVVYSLSRDNNTSNAMKRNMNNNIPSDDLLQRLYEVDSNSGRRSLVIACIKAAELARQEHFKDAIKELERIFKDKKDKSKGKKEALKHITLLLHKYNHFKDKSMSEFLALVNEEIKPTSGLRPGAPKIFYENHTYQQLSICVKIIEDKSFHRTIHKTKGAEFDNVLLILKRENDLEFLLNPDLDEEEHRINYVAVSRAKEQLFITVPSLSAANKVKLETLFNIMED